MFTSIATVCCEKSKKQQAASQGTVVTGRKRAEKRSFAEVPEEQGDIVMEEGLLTLYNSSRKEERNVYDFSQFGVVLALVLEETVPSKTSGFLEPDQAENGNILAYSSSEEEFGSQDQNVFINLRKDDGSGNASAEGGGGFCYDTDFEKNVD